MVMKNKRSKLETASKLPEIVPMAELIDSNIDKTFTKTKLD